MGLMGAEMTPSSTAIALRFGRAGLFRAIRSGLVCGLLTLAAVSSMAKVCLADEGGVSFWVPGFFGSLAAVPQQPGWALGTIYYHTSVSAGAAVPRGPDFPR